MPLESYVMMKARITRRSERSVHKKLTVLCSSEVILVLGVIIEHVVDAAPEAGGPCGSTYLLVLSFRVDSVDELVGRAEGHLRHLCVDLGKQILEPCLIFSKKLFTVLHL